MLGNMMKKNSHRVDYLNFKAVGIKGSFGIYVSGNLQEDQPYSSEAKRRLFLSLDYARRKLDEEKLVAVYMDIVNFEQPENFAFREMESDLQNGFFEKVLFADLEEIFNNPELSEKLFSLAENLEGIEFIDVQGNLIEAKKSPINHILGV
jgi:hypothetical protein